MNKYNPKYIEPKWRKFWEENPDLYRAKDNSRKDKRFIMVEFPYPSGAGLHVGHVRSYTALDIYSRKLRMQGYNVLYPIGWDAFGLPTENYAIKHKIHPSVATRKNIATFKRQLKSLGLSYDWSREINTTDPAYYKWTQWVFLKLFEHGLAYKAKIPVNWCPSCKIVLANEEVIDGKCERCGTMTEKREKEQWMLAITKYADRLIKDLDTVNYLEKIKTQQVNWIGKSEGSIVKFRVINKEPSPASKTRHPLPKGEEESFIEVFTTRVDTIYGCTYCVVAPEHPLLKNKELGIKNYEEVQKYIKDAQKKTELERTELQKEKTGVEIKGVKVINPFTNEELPLYVADYVLGFYGTGAVMAVPAHDERDFEFARKYNLPIKKVIEPCFWQMTEPGKIREDKPFKEREAILAIVKHWKEEKYLGLKWKQVAWQTFITGGPENGQSFEEAARTEVLEETGYKNLKLVKELPRMHSKFYHVPKELNRFAHFRTFYFELKNGEQETISEKEKNMHEVIWLTKEEIEKVITPESQKYVFRVLQGWNNAYTDDGILADSGEYSGLDSVEAREKMTKWLEKNKLGKKQINYKLRDWIFSRQHYWGEPIPMVHCEKCGIVPVPEKDLPVKLPNVKNYEPTDTGESPLAKMTSWVNTKCPKCKGKAKRETDTMPNWAGSSWYFLRYIDPKNDKKLADPKKLKYWMPVDLYNGGMEHTTLHLLYSRFWNKFLFDIGVSPVSEPYARRHSHGMVLAEDGKKMSKSLGNVINPDDVVGQFGADSLRIYEMFMGPFSEAIPWSTKSLVGVYRFLERIWKIYDSHLTEDKKKIQEGQCSFALRDGANLEGRQKEAAKKEVEIVQRQLNKTIKKVTEDIDNFRFNTAISEMMILVNTAIEFDISKEKFEKFLILLSPFAPHISEELWNHLGHKDSIFKESWPKYDPKLIKDEEVELVVQVNGKVRDKIVVSANVSEEEAKKIVMESEKVKGYIDGKEIRKVIFVKGRLINIVI